LKRVHIKNTIECTLDQLIKKTTSDEKKPITQIILSDEDLKYNKKKSLVHKLYGSSVERATKESGIFGLIR
jgi:hypothetical protein